MRDSRAGSGRGRHSKAWGAYVLIGLVVVLFVIVNWPYRYVDTLIVLGLSYPRHTQELETIVCAGWPLRYYDSWRDEAADLTVVTWDAASVAVNLLLAVVAIAGLALRQRWRTRRGKSFFQLSLADALGLLLLLALPLGWWRMCEMRAHRQRELVQQLERRHVRIQTRLRAPAWTSRFRWAQRLDFFEQIVHATCNDPRTLELVLELSELEQLQIAGDELRDADLALLQKLPRLKSLELDAPNVTNEGLNHLLPLTQLRCLQIGRAGIDTRGLATLQGMPNLTDLALAFMSLTDDDLPPLSELRQLRTLDLRTPNIRGSGLVSLHGHPNLRTLRVGRRAERGVSLNVPPLMDEVVLVGLPRLQTLHLPGSVTRLHLKDLPSLIYAGPHLLNSRRGMRSLGSRLEVESAVLVNLENLRELELHVRVLRELRLENLPALETLSLTGSPQPAFGEPRDGPPTHAAVSDAMLEQIGRLTTLRVLDLSGTSVSDAGLAHLSRLVNLEELSLAQTRVGDAGMPFLRPMTRLRALNLADTRVGDDGWAVLPHLAALQSLELGGTAITKLELHGLRDLRHLGVEKTSLRALHLSDLPQLEYLSRITAEPGAVIQLTDLPKLSSVFLRGPRPGRLAFQGLTGLTSLDLAGTGAPDGWLVGIADSPLIETLNLRGTQITDDGLVLARGRWVLSDLDLQDTSVTDTGLKHLARLRGLTRLNLTGTTVTDAGLHELRSLTQLELLYLGRTRITGPGLASLQNLTQLHKLSLGETAVTSDSLISLAGLNNLTWLRLSDTPIDDEAIWHLANLPNLKRLYLNGTEVTNRGLRRLAIVSFDELDVAETKVTEEAANMFNDRRGRKVVHLARTR